MEEDGLQQELALLEAIYLGDLTVEHSESATGVSCVRVQLYPATGDNAEEKYVCLTLEFNLTNGYPDEVPEMVISNPRGLADDHVMKLRQSLREVATQHAGAPMLYELIELGKESLTEANVPQGQCVICLELLEPGETFTKTECYHYFHVGCLLRYVEHCHDQMEQEREEIRQHKHMTHEKKAVVCPVCREPIATDLASLRAQAPAAEAQPAPIMVSPEVRALQRKMAALYAHQQAKGGIIDVEAERNKFLIPSESSFPEAAHAAPLHLFSQDQLPEALSAAYLSHGGKGRGRPLPGRGHEWSGVDRPDRRETRNDYRKEIRHRERRSQGREKSREEKTRPDSSGRPHERNFKSRPADRDQRVGCGGDADGGPPWGKGRETCRQYNRVHGGDNTILDDSHYDKSYPPRRPRRGGKQTTEGNQPRHVTDQHYEKVRREEQNGHRSAEYQLNDFSRLDVSASGGDMRRPHQRGPGHGRAVGAEREGRQTYECEPSNRAGQSDREAPRREGRRWSGQGRGRNHHDGHGGKPTGGGGCEPRQNDANLPSRRDVESNHSFNDNSSRCGERKGGASELLHESRAGYCDQDYKYDARSQPPRYDRRKPAHDRQLPTECDSGRTSRGHSSGRSLPPPGLNACKPPPGFLQQARGAHYRPRAPPRFDTGS